MEHPISWNTQLEELLKKEGERCLSLFWLHHQAEQIYSHRNHFIALPVIVLSALNGSLSLGSESLFGKADWTPIFVGFVSVGVGLLNTISTQFGWLRRAESHKVGAIHQQKLYKFLSVELALPRSERIAAQDLLKMVREQMDRLLETCPAIPPYVLALQKERFGDDQPKVARPEITNGLNEIRVQGQAPEVESRVKITLAEV